MSAQPKVKPASGKKSRTRSLRNKARAAALKVHFFQSLPEDSDAQALVRRCEDGELNVQQLNNRLMVLYRDSSDVSAFSALYQLNYKHFLNIINRRLNGYRQMLSPADLLQDVFMLSYRYPDKFRHDHDRSFYNWSYSIILNTIRRKLKSRGVKTVDIKLLSDSIPDKRNPGPLRRLMTKEDIHSLKQLYAIYLMLYLNTYRLQLNEREKKALHLVEVDGDSYKDAAKRLQLRYDNFKMVICRARKKISMGISLLLDRLPAVKIEGAPARCALRVPTTVLPSA